MKQAALALVVLSFAAVSSQALAQVDAGVSAGIYLPTSGEIRDAFGSQIFRFGFGSVGAQKTGNVQIGTNLDFITASRDGNRMLIIPWTVEVEQALTQDRNAMTKPYVKAFAGVAYMDYSIDRGGMDVSDRSLSTTIGAEVGIVLSNRLRLSARYNTFPKSNGFDFSGITLSATVSLLQR